MARLDRATQQAHVRAIDGEKVYLGARNRTDLALATLLIAMCAALLIYRAHALSACA
jgi:hypothetical protein